MAEDCSKREALKVGNPHGRRFSCRAVHADTGLDRLDGLTQLRVLCHTHTKHASRPRNASEGVAEHQTGIVTCSFASTGLSNRTLHDLVVEIHTPHRPSASEILADRVNGAAHTILHLAEGAPEFLVSNNEKGSRRTERTRASKMFERATLLIVTIDLVSGWLCPRGA